VSTIVNGGKYYARSKPQFEEVPLSYILSARVAGAQGNGVADDTAALNNALRTAANERKVLFLDAGTYRVTDTIYIPPGSRIVGESFSVIMSSGPAFNDANNPRAVVRVGSPDETGTVEWTDTIVSTQGQQAGAVLIEWNLMSNADAPSGMWDVHTRIGGFAGSNLQVTLHG